MKKQIFFLMLGAAIAVTSPSFAMEADLLNEDANKHITPQFDSLDESQFRDPAKQHTMIISQLMAIKGEKDHKPACSNIRHSFLLGERKFELVHTYVKGLAYDINQSKLDAAFDKDTPITFSVIPVDYKRALEYKTLPWTHTGKTFTFNSNISIYNQPILTEIMNSNDNKEIKKHLFEKHGDSIRASHIVTHMFSISEVPTIDQPHGTFYEWEKMSWVTK